jgi:tetratricopeptide (TPR) repeat protein
MFTKEIMITLPVMILVYEYAFLRAPGRNVSWKHVIPMLLTMAIIPLVMISSRPVEMSLSPAAWDTVFQGKEYWREIRPTRISSLLTQVKVMAAYIRLILVPVNQNIDYAYPFVKTFSDPSLLASILFVGAALYSALRWFARYPLTAFGVLWFFITLLPESAVITLGDPMLEHRLYMPMAFFSVSLAATLYYLVKDGRFRAFVALMLAAAACYSVMSYKRNDVWRSELSIWNDVIRKSPMNARAYNNRGHLYEDMGETEMALADYNAAVSLAPKYPPARGSRGTLLYKRGDVDGALADYDVALRADSNDYLTYCNLGAIYIQKGEPDAAIGNLDKSIAINPHYDKAFNNRGVAYMDKGELGKAIADFDKAIWLNGDYPEAFDNRGMARLRGGEFDAAIADFDAALRIEPNFGRAYVNRAIARYNKGEYEKSRKDVLRAQGLGAYVPPDFIERLKYAPGAGG